MKLTKKFDSPCLSFEIDLSSITAGTTAITAVGANRFGAGSNLRVCTHDIPVSLIPRKHWSDFKEPVVQKFDVSIYLPDIKKLKHIVDRYKNLDHTVILQANRKGDLKLTLENERVTVATYFKNLDTPAFVNYDDGKFNLGDFVIMELRL